MKSLSMKVALAAAALIAGQAALAQGYVGGAAGQSRINIDCAGADTCDKTDTGWKLYGGFRWPMGLAVEGNYFDWGKASASATDPEIGTGTLKVRGTGVGVGLAYFMPLATAWNCVARVGVARSKGKTTAKLGGLSASETFNSTEPYYGAGCGYAFGNNVTLTLEADFSRVKYAPDEKANTRLLSVGVRWPF